MTKRLRLWLFAALGGGAALTAAWAVLSKYNPTTTGLPNLYTIEAAFNVFRLERFFEAALAAVRGRLNSCYRSAKVNLAVGGEPPSPSAPRGSRHTRALAIDVAPADGNLDAAMRKLHDLAVAGNWPVVQLIKETAKGIVHVSFASVFDRVPKAPQLLEQPTREPKYVTYQLRAA